MNRLYSQVVHGHRVIGWLRTGAVLAMLAAGTVVVYATGGTQFVWPHLMYFPVLTAGVAFGRRAGAATGVLAGLLLGPLMPLDVAAGVDQSLRGWLTRLGFYLAVGLLAGYTRYRFYRLLGRRKAFLSSLSHELRTPLAGTLGFAEILRREWDELSEDEKLEMVDHIYRESVEVAHVVDDLLAASRLETGELRINPEPVDIRRIADSIVDSLPNELGGSRIRVGGAAESWADPVRVRHIIRNLITNALVQGADTVTVDLATTPQMITVRISCDGHESPDILLPRLFEPFPTATMPSSPSQSVGLGLAVARELARRMGGRLTYSRDTSNSAFLLELPTNSQPTSTNQQPAALKEARWVRPAPALGCELPAMNRTESCSAEDGCWKGRGTHVHCGAPE